MLIPDISEEPRRRLGRKHGHAQRVDRGIAESFVEEPAMLVEPVKVLLVLFCSEEVEASDLEVREELAVVVLALVIHEPVEICVGVD